MDIFERNQPRRLALAEAIKKAEIELELTDQFYRLQILKQQQKMQPLYILNLNYAVWMVHIKNLNMSKTVKKHKKLCNR